jgi:plastocyanin
MFQRLVEVLVIPTVTIALIACGGSKETKKPVIEKPQIARTKSIDPATVGTVRGVVLFDGNVPGRSRITFSGAGPCRVMHDGPVFQKDAVIQDGKLKNVFMHIRSGLEEFILPSPPSTEVEIDQKGCIYNPRVTAIRVGQSLTFINSDKLLHNVNVRPEDNRTSNYAMPRLNQRKSRKFRRSEVMVPIKCDVHPWMRAWIGVMDHPFHSVSTADGSYEIQGLPPGEYELEAWHERFGIQTAKITIKANEATDVGFTFKPK